MKRGVEAVLPLLDKFQNVVYCRGKLKRTWTNKNKINFFNQQKASMHSGPFKPKRDPTIGGLSFVSVYLRPCRYYRCIIQYMYTGEQTAHIKTGYGYQRIQTAYIKAYLNHSSTSNSLLQSWEFEIICTKCTKTVSHVALDRFVLWSEKSTQNIKKIKKKRERNENLQDKTELYYIKPSDFSTKCWNHHLNFRAEFLHLGTYSEVEANS